MKKLSFTIIFSIFKSSVVWEYLLLDFRYSIELSKDQKKLIRKMTMSKIARKKLFVDESRIWNLEEPAAGAASTMSTNIRSILLGYVWTDIHVEHKLNISGNSKNLDTVGIYEKNLLLRMISGYLCDSPRQDNFYCYQIQHWTVLYTVLSSQIFFYENKVGRIFVPKFHHDKRDTNFLKFLSYVGEYGPDNSRCEFPQIGRKLYEYKKKQLRH